MSDFNDDRARQVIPRWRSFAAATQFGELTSLKVRRDVFNDDMLAGILEDWRREPGLSAASEVVSAALTIGRTKPAEEAARFVLSNDDAPAIARDIATQCLQGTSQPSSRFLTVFSQPAFDHLQTSIGECRRQLREYPRNSVLWTNLALQWTTIGEPEKARRAMQIALGLTPLNRFVVRAACRMHLHQGDPDEAHWVLMRSAATKWDPWMVASEVAVSAVRNRGPQLIKQARNMVLGKSLSPFHVSELAGAMATLEASSGQTKNARRLCQLSLVDPAENAVAQIAWLGRNVKSLGSNLDPKATALSNEARTWASIGGGDWTNAFKYAKRWQMEQPFSSRPAMCASYVASTGLEDFEEAAKILRQSLVSNPDDPVLHNNLAFSLAKQGEIAAAMEVLQKTEQLVLNPRDEICLTATRGLVAFRMGNELVGRSFYKKAIDRAKSASLPQLAWIAQIYLAIEETRMGSIGAELQLKAADEAALKLPDSLRSTFQKKLEKAKSDLANHM
jgi:tetratricopeptide (TPR) repeat protein